MGVKLRYTLLLILLTGCAHKFIEVKYEPNKTLWIGRNSDEVLLHPEFATLRMETRKASNGDELITFKNSGGHHSSAGCITNYGITTCSGNNSEIVCNHLFHVKDGVVFDYNRLGNCSSDEELRFRPRTSNGDPLLTQNETALIQKKKLLEKRDCSFIGKAIRAQGCE